MNTSRRRVVVTGMGAITPLGNDVETSWRRAIEGRSGIGPVTRFDASPLDSRIAGEVKGFNAEDYVSAKELRRMDRFTHYAVAACKQAVNEARLQIHEDNARDIGVVISSAIGGLESLTDAVLTAHNKSPQKVSPFAIPMVIVDLAGSQVAIQLGVKGPNFAVVTACASSSNAIGEAAEIIRRGDGRVMFAGGTEAAICLVGMASFDVMRALSARNDTPEKASRPFDKLRDGFVMGEGAAVLLLEDLDYALARGAPILAEISGYGTTTDAVHVTAPAPDAEGATWAMRLALRAAGLEPKDIDYINAHGTSTPLNEKFETMAIKKAFGDWAYKIPVSSTKSVTGHMLGAAGAMEAIMCVKAIHDGVVPPTINQEYPDPECDLDTVPNEARVVNVRRAMSNSLGFGGHNAVLVVEKFEG